MNEVKGSSRARWIAIGVAVLALAAVACMCTGSGAGTATTVPPTTVPATTVPATAVPTQAPATDGGTTGGTTDGGTTDGSGGGNIDLTIINNTDVSICYVYIASSDDLTTYGDEVLGTDTIIPAGETDVVSGPPGIFDIILEDCDHNVIAWNYRADLSSSNTLTVSGSSDILYIINNTSHSLCEVYISSPDEENWGRSHLNPDHPIETGETRNFAVTSGVWDLKAVTCDGLDVERRGEDLTGGFEWTLTD